MKTRPNNASRSQWLAYARFLAVFTIFYNLAEGIVSMGFGWADDSMALFGFGADSFIEVGPPWCSPPSLARRVSQASARH